MRLKKGLNFLVKMHVAGNNFSPAIVASTSKTVGQACPRPYQMLYYRSQDCICYLNSAWLDSAPATKAEDSGSILNRVQIRNIMVKFGNFKAFLLDIQHRKQYRYLKLKKKGVELSPYMVGRSEIAATLIDQ